MPRHSREALIRDLRELTERLGTIPKTADVNETPDTASATTYRSRFGSWPEAINTAELRDLVSNDEIFECPTCEAPFATSHGMKAHHAADHGEALAQVTVECEYCGGKFNEHQSRIENGRGRYCSRECYDLDGAIETECFTCGQEMTVQKHREEAYEHVFCSLSCQGEWRSDTFVGESHPQYDSVAVECSICGDEIERAKGRVEMYEDQLCSKDCFKAWCSEIRVGEKNPSWEGGYEPFYGSRWSHVRRLVLERDGYECQSCGFSREDSYEKYGWDLEVHHIIPLRTFDDPGAANELDNLTTLCRACHVAADAGIEDSGIEA